MNGDLILIFNNCKVSIVPALFVLTFQVFGENTLDSAQHRICSEDLFPC